MKISNDEIINDRDQLIKMLREELNDLKGNLVIFIMLV